MGEGLFGPDRNYGLLETINWVVLEEIMYERNQNFLVI
jgi:hypothetical protein